MTLFRPCIDLHHGEVKQIVGSTLSQDGNALRTNFISPHPARWFAEKYRKDGLRGGHVIKLGSGNEESALEALRAYPGGLQIGGGITPNNALEYLDAGASHVIVTSALFDQQGRFQEETLRQFVSVVGRKHLVIDLSCRRTAEGWQVAMNRWQDLTESELSQALLERLSYSCSEFLIHAADVEGLCNGIDEELVIKLGEWAICPITYAGGAKDLEDLDRVDRLSRGRVDLTIGSALDVFGGQGARYQDCVQWNQRRLASDPSDPA